MKKSICFMVMLLMLLTACSAEKAEQQTAVRTESKTASVAALQDGQIHANQSSDTILEKEEYIISQESNVVEATEEASCDNDISEKTQEIVPETIVPDSNEEPEALTHVHIYATQTVQATCSETGYTRHECVCGKSFTEDLVPPLGHDYQEAVIAATTEAGGYTIHTCTRCGDTYKDQETEKLENQYDINAAMDAGNTYAQMLGFSLDPTLPLSQGTGYSPPTTISGDTITEVGGQSWLNQCAMDTVQYEYDSILGTDGFLGETRGWSHITYDRDSDTYTVYFLYG